MKNIRLLLIILVLVVVAVLLQQSKKPATSADPLLGKSLVSAGEIDQIRKVDISTAQGKIELEQIDGDWRLINLHKLQADKNRIEELFQRLNAANMVEMVSANPERHGDMGVASLLATATIVGDDRAHIVLSNAQGKEVKDILLGNGRKAKNVDGTQGWGNDGQYCRLSGNNNVYLLSSFIWLEKRLKGWLGKQLLQIASEKLSKIAWTYPEEVGEKFTLSRGSASESLALEGLDTDMQTRKTTADAAASVFANLLFDDFIATASPELYPELDEHVGLWLETFDGLRLSMRISSGPVELPGIGKMSLVWLTGEYSGSDKELRAMADELTTNSQKFVFALREQRLKPLMIKSGNLKEPKPKPASAASGTADAADLAKVEASHILVAYKGAERSKAERSEEEAKKLVEELLARIKKGDSFEKIAEEYSDCPSGKAKNGALGEFGRGVMAKEFEKSAFSLKVGEISGIVKTAFGYHIIRRDK